MNLKPVLKFRITDKYKIYYMIGDIYIAFVMSYINFKKHRAWRSLFEYKTLYQSGEADFSVKTI